jgi:hypothetical protein
MEFLLVFAVGLIIYSLSLWLGAKMIGDEGKWLEFLIIAAIASAVSLIPYFGGLISILVFFILLNKLMDIDVLKGIVICALAFCFRLGAGLLIVRLLAR